MEVSVGRAPSSPPFDFASRIDLLCGLIIDRDGNIGDIFFMDTDLRKSRRHSVIDYSPSLVRDDTTTPSPWISLPRSQVRTVLGLIPHACIPSQLTP
jgi:hypothetical protein